jgi:hypothetical protein
MSSTQINLRKLQDKDENNCQYHVHNDVRAEQ